MRKHNYSGLIIVILLLMVCNLICSPIVAEEGSNKNQIKGSEIAGEDNQNGNENSLDSYEMRIEAFIKPYKFGDVYKNNWFFYQVEKIEPKDIVFSLKNKKTRQRLFVWLTKKNESVGPQYQTKNFNVIFASENESILSKEQTKLAIEIIELIRQNDIAETLLSEKDLLEDGGFKVILQKEGKRKNFGFLSINIVRIVWISLLVILAGVFFIRLFKEKDVVEAGTKETESDQT